MVLDELVNAESKNKDGDVLAEEEAEEDTEPVKTMVLVEVRVEDHG